jgi:hypothetical protein
MSRFILSFVLVLVACGGDAKPKPAAPAPRTAAELGPMCERFYVHQRRCVTEYLGALVDVRAEYDQPPGIAAHVKEAGRDAVIAEARVEWDRDTTPERTAMICQAMVEKTPPEHVERLLKDGETCEAITECGAFAKCAVDTERSYIQSRAKH